MKSKNNSKIYIFNKLEETTSLNKKQNESNLNYLYLQQFYNFSLIEQNFLNTIQIKRTSFKASFFYKYYVQKI